MNAIGKTALLLGAAAAGAWWLFGKRSQASYSFTGKVVLITGGSRGLGLVLARQLAREGARLAICARDPDELARAAADIAACGRAPLTFACDISDAARVQEMVEQVQRQLGPVDVLINNAGTIAVGPVSTMTREDYERALRIIFWGTYNTTEAVVPGMRQRRDGRIVNISSIGGRIGVPHLLPYCAAKFAVTGYSQGLRAELADDGITVTSVYPGLMRTGSPRNALFKGKRDLEFAWFAISDALPGLSMSAEEAAGEILDACRRGDAELVLTAPARLAVLLQGLISLANRLLPSPDSPPPAALRSRGEGGAPQSRNEEARPGKESETPWLRQLLARLTGDAAERNNEIAPAER
jgi:NAD(P)-dependent dehydrogenase (short-subunit alcohol dehydrogenase family)